MATHPDFPGASSQTKNGKTYWRFRADRKAKVITLPGQPGDVIFTKAYQLAMLGGERVRPADLVKLPTAGLPKTFGVAMRMLEVTPEWDRYDPKTKKYNRYHIEDFLDAHPIEGSPLTWRDSLISMMTAKHLRDYLAPMRKQYPSKAKHRLVAIRKLIAIALEEEWIELDPSSALKLRVPPTDGHKPWPREIRERFMAHHLPGSQARTAYELAFWLGNRRGDLAGLDWEHLVNEEIELPNGEFAVLDAFAFNQQKNRKRTGGKEMFLPIRKPLGEALAALSGKRIGPVLLTAYGQRYSEKSLTGMMAHWTKQAGIQPGYTLHGLRKSYGIWLAENGATARQIQDALGHSSTAEAEKYIRQANRKRLVSDAFFITDEREEKRVEARAKQAHLRLVG